MKPYYDHAGITIYHGDCREVLPGLSPVDAVLTDPPYGLSFMGKKWDCQVPSVDLWSLVFQACKPGAHLLAFAGTRTQHRMACNIEDAGFEIRDMIAWVYAQGFPKSLDVSKAIDKEAGAEREVIGKSPRHVSGKPNQRTKGLQGSSTFSESVGMGQWVTSPATPAAKQWDGYGTALKPSHEIIGIYQKELPPLVYCSNMITNLTERIESCRQSASNAEKNSRHSQADLQEEKISAALENAATLIEEVPKKVMETGKGDATNSRADTSESILETESIVWSTLLSWKRTLEGACDAMRTSTTPTVFETITDWKILSYSLSQITQSDIIKAKCNPSGLNADALRAIKYLSVSIACLENTLMLSARVPAMSKEADSCRDVGASPALEPITLARRPLAEPTVAKNVLAHGTGALDIDGCRVGTESLNYRTTSYRDAASGEFSAQGQINVTTGYKQASGRFPANLIHDGSEEVLKGFPETGSGKRREVVRKRDAGWCNSSPGGGVSAIDNFGDSGSAARFFYCAKASSQDRSPDNDHPTVKPSSLFRYLVQLITPPGATILDPFLGSGTTLQAAKDLNRKAIGIEIEERYCEIAAQRLAQEVLDLGL